MNCRQKYLTPGENNGLNKQERAAAFLAADPARRRAKYEHFASFNDLGLVLKNTATGKTCFFTYFGDKYYGGYLPPPDQATPLEAEAVYAALPEPKPPRDLFDDAYWNVPAQAKWFPPRDTANGNCVVCHDMGGFKHSPFILQAGLVPSNERKPYLPVGPVFQAKFREAQLRDVTTEKIDGEPQKCTTCHRMAAGGSTCSKYLGWSVGEFPPEMVDLMSDSARAFPGRAWMPEDNEAESHAQYVTLYKKHIDALKCCCADPTAKGCKSKGYGPTEAEVDATWTAGAGPAACL